MYACHILGNLRQGWVRENCFAIKRLSTRRVIVTLFLILCVRVCLSSSGMKTAETIDHTAAAIGALVLSVPKMNVIICRVLKTLKPALFSAERVSLV